jgi:hypothetical protein
MTTTTHDLAPVPNEILKTDCKGRIRFPARMREQLLDEYERSGMSGAEFAAYYNIKYPTFATWRQRRKREQKKAVKEGKNCSLIEVAVEDVRESTGVQIALPGGASVRITNKSEAALAAEVLKGLSGC